VRSNWICFVLLILKPHHQEGSGHKNEKLWNFCINLTLSIDIVNMNTAAAASEGVGRTKGVKPSFPWTEQAGPGDRST
jgi:hypothetical protein